MRFSPISFLLGMAVASLVPALARVFRPFAVEATAAGMGMIEDGRRIFAEQLETLEDIVAEARARREQLDAEATAMPDDETPGQAVEEPATGARARRRTNGAGRRRTS